MTADNKRFVESQRRSEVLALWKKRPENERTHRHLRAFYLELELEYPSLLHSSPIPDYRYHELERVLERHFI